MEQPFTNRENNVEVLAMATERVGNTLRQELSNKFSGLEYHNIKHSVGVAKNALFFLEKTDSSPEDLLLTEVAGLGHDIDQSFSWLKAASGIGDRRVRNTEAIELASAEYVLELLSKEGAGLAQKDIGIVYQAILGTVPAYNAELGTVVQPNVTAISHPITWAIAAADLATSGYDSTQFMLDGDTVFNEDRRLPILDTLTASEHIALHKEVLAWTENQITYARGRKKYWSRVGVPEFIKEKLTAFDISIELCRERYTRRKDMSLEDLLLEMNFTRYIPSAENV